MIMIMMMMILRFWNVKISLHLIKHFDVFPVFRWNLSGLWWATEFWWVFSFAVLSCFIQCILEKFAKNFMHAKIAWLTVYFPALTTTGIRHCQAVLSLLQWLRCQLWTHVLQFFSLVPNNGRGPLPHVILLTGSFVCVYLSYLVLFWKFPWQHFSINGHCFQFWFSLVQVYRKDVMISPLPKHITSFCIIVYWCEVYTCIVI